MPQIEIILSTFSNHITNLWLLVDSTSQQLFVFQNNSKKSSFSVSTSKYGLGCQQDSNKTPTGAHCVAEKIGGNGFPNEIYKGRQATGEAAEIICTAQHSDEDLILSRIMWLRGLEDGHNHGEDVDSYHRYIYIHGTQEEGLLGTPASHGCIRMSNQDVMNLYEQVAEGTFVYIR
ncbi:MAG: L,D-transpeptidase [Pseudomonadota bacterium]